MDYGHPTGSWGVPGWTKKSLFLPIFFVHGHHRIRAQTRKGADSMMFLGCQKGVWRGGDPISSCYEGGLLLFDGGGPKGGSPGT